MIKKAGAINDSLSDLPGEIRLNKTSTFGMLDVSQMAIYLELPEFEMYW